VPVVTLAGDRHVSRMSASILSRVGADDLVAHSEDEYVAIAARLAGDPARLRDFRAGLRAAMAASPLCDGPAFARAMEAAYRDMWRRWCAG
jgi:predicted O-linked N-acetylglucosamine transferase (SPINDLY family)